MKELHLTQRELDVMSVLWQMEEATVTEIRDHVDPSLAYTSVSTIVRTLELKGYVAHRRGEGKTHLYRPVVGAEVAGSTALRRLIEKIYGGSPARLLAHFLGTQRLTAKEIAEVRHLLDRPKRKR